MKYFNLINGLWQSHEVNQLNTTEIALYFYIVKIFNFCHWVDSIKRLNTKIEADLSISYPTLQKSRNKLKQAGLIDFKTTNGSGNVTYTLKNILKVDDEVCDEVDSEVGDEVGSEVECDIIKTRQDKTRQRDKEANASKVEEPASISEIANSSKGSSETPFVEEPPIPSKPPAEERKKVPQKKESDATVEKEICDKVKEYYNTNCIALNPVKVLTDARKSSILARIREYGSETIFAMLDNAASSVFLAGQNKRGWKADFDWVFKPTNFVKVLEGNFTDQKVKTMDLESTLPPKKRNYNEQIF